MELSRSISRERLGKRVGITRAWTGHMGIVAERELGGFEGADLVVNS
jgi:hypothetical protein